MENKVVLVLVDGMRSEALLNCGHPYVPELIARSAHALDARTVMPSVTLPCHMSLFHSVDPDRHGILTNDYVPQVRPIVGLFDQLDTFGKKNGFFYTWEQLRDLCRPGHLHTALFINQGQQTDTDRKITDAAMKFIAAEDPDFTFIYLGETDEVGHAHGWMGPEYMGAVHNAIDCIRQLHAALPENYTLIVTADHGGHGRSHGLDIPEDMIIPILFCGPAFAPDTALENVSIKDIPTTIAKLLNIPRVKEWEGQQCC